MVLLLEGWEYNLRVIEVELGFEDSEAVDFRTI